MVRDWRAVKSVQVELEEKWVGGAGLTSAFPCAAKFNVISNSVINLSCKCHIREERNRTSKKKGTKVGRGAKLKVKGGTKKIMKVAKVGGGTKEIIWVAEVGRGTKEKWK